MRNSRNVIIVLLIAVIIGIGIFTYQESSEGPLERSAERVDQSIEDAGDSIESTTDDIAN